MNHESKRPITVEDIIRLKRAEQPPAEFWEQFERQLRAKQLAALVEKSPWWRSLPRAFGGLSRYSLPIGASAILAITFFATRDYHPTAMPLAPGDDTAVTAVTAVAQPVDSLTANFDAAISSAREMSTRVATTEARGASASIGGSAGEIGAADLTDTPDASSAAAAPLFASARMEVEEISPSARHIAANLAAAQAAAPALARGLLGSPRGFEERAMPVRFTTEPLEQVSTPAERSRARFATAMVTSFNGDTRGRMVSANVARRISDERVYDDDAIRRVGATGNSVAWRF